jgi:serine/threonine kinase PknH
VSSPPPPDPWPAEPSTPERVFAEPDPDEDDTGPVQIPTPTPAEDSTSESGLGEYDWSRRFADALTINPRPVRHSHKPIVFFGVVALVAVVVVGGLAFWLLRPSPVTQSAGTGPTTSVDPSPPDADAQERLLRMLPPGYPSGSCKAMAAPEYALAQVNCGKNSDPGGPLSATYKLVRDKAALDAALNNFVTSSARVNCPGNIQSPGPWRRNAAPDKLSGVLFCGVHDGRSTVAWTDEARLVVSEVQSGPQGPTFDELYAWWSSHS